MFLTNLVSFSLLTSLPTACGKNLQKIQEFYAAWLLCRYYVLKLRRCFWNFRRFRGFCLRRKSTKTACGVPEKSPISYRNVAFSERYSTELVPKCRFSERDSTELVPKCRIFHELNENQKAHDKATRGKVKQRRLQYCRSQPMACHYFSVSRYSDGCSGFFEIFGDTYWYLNKVIFCANFYHSVGGFQPCQKMWQACLYG